MTANKPSIEVVALVIFLKPEKKYLIMQRAAHDSGAGDWEFPGGKKEMLESNEIESDLVALRREIQEELDLDLSNYKDQDFIFVGESYTEFETKGIKLKLYMILTEQKFQIKLIEHQNLAWIEEDEFSLYKISELDQEFLPKVFKITDFGRDSV